MSNNTTPMQLLKYHLDITKKMTSFAFKCIDLRTKKSKSNPYHSWHDLDMYSLPVKSDFLFVFNCQKTKSNFAFVFDYKEKEKKDWTIKVSYKPVEDYHWEQTKDEKEALNKNIQETPSFSINKFKELLKQFNNSIENTQDIDLIFNKLFEIFFDNDDRKVFNEEVNKETIKIETLIKNKENNLPIDKAELSKEKDNHEKLVKSIDDQIKKSPEYIRKIELEKELENLNKEIREKKEELEDTLSVKKIALDLFKKKILLNKFEKNKKGFIEDEIQKIKPTLRNAVRNALNSKIKGE